MESGAVPTPAEEDGFCDLDDDDDSSAVEDDAGELEDRYYVGEEELLDYIVRRNEQETAAAAAREDLVGREQREEEAEEEPEGAGTDSAPWAGLDHDVPSSSASGLAANLVREDRTHYQNSIPTARTFLPPVGSASTRSGRKEGITGNRKYRKEVDEQTRQNCAKVAPRLDRSTGPLRVCELPTGSPNGHLPLFACDAESFLEGASAFGKPRRDKRRASDGDQTESTSKRRRNRARGQAGGDEEDDGDEGDGDPGDDDGPGGGGGDNPDDPDDGGDGDDGSDGDDPDDPDYDPDDDGASNDDCEEEPDERRHRVEHDLHSGLADAAAGKRPYEVRRTVTDVGVVEPPAKRPVATSFVTSSTLVVPRIHMDYRTDRWTHASLWKPTSSVIDEMVAAFPKKDTMRINLISNADAASETRIGHASNDHSAWKTFGKGTAGVMTLLGEAVASSKGNGEHQWHMSLVFDGDLIDEPGVRDLLKKAGWRIGWRKGRIAEGTARRRLDSWLGRLFRSPRFQSEQTKTALVRQFQQQGAPYSLYQQRPVHPVLSARAGDVLDVAIATGSSTSVSTSGLSTCASDSGRPLPIRVTAAPECPLPSTASGSLPNRNTTYWQAANPLIWIAFGDAKSGSESLVCSRTRFGEGDAASELTAAVGFLHDEDAMHKAVSWLTGGVKSQNEVGLLPLAPPRGVTTLVRRLAHRTIGAHVRDSAAELAMRHQRPIYAFILFSSSDGRTELSCLPTPLTTEPEIGYHFSSAGLFPVHRFGASVRFEQGGGLQPGRKTRQAIETGRPPRRVKQVGDPFPSRVRQMLSPSGYKVKLRYNSKDRYFVIQLPTSNLFRSDFGRLLKSYQTLHFNPRVEKKEAGKAGVAETWEKTDPDKRPKQLYLWLQNRRLVFRTHVPNNSLTAKNPTLESKVTGSSSKLRIRLWELNTRALQLQGLLARSEDEEDTGEGRAEEEVRALMNEMDSIMTTIDNNPLLAARRYVRDLRRESVNMDLPVFVSNRHLMADASHPAMSARNSSLGWDYAHVPKEFGLEPLFEMHPLARAIFFIRAPCKTCEGCRSGGPCSTINPTGVPGAQPVVFSGAAAVGGSIIRVERSNPAESLYLAHFAGGNNLRVMYEVAQLAATIEPGTETREGWRDIRWDRSLEEK